MAECICEFPDECDGSGMLYCDGCGGDICVCAACQGAGCMECPGCEQCANGDDDDHYLEDEVLHG